MSYSQGQSTYNIFPSAAIPGMYVDAQWNLIDSMVAASDIPPGRAVELASDGASLQLCQQTSSTCAPVGVSILDTAREGTGPENLTTTNGGAVYHAGEMVPYMRRGRVFGEWSGTTQTAFTSPNIYHSSTTTTNQGKFTDTATATTSGAEVSTAPAGIQTRLALTGSGNVISLDVNFPGHS